ncbi:hypothetical protein KPA97_68520, partial [Burkholderia cenocepacia]|nr:hypothetical protein [Burkholderia cenocepacia]
VQLPFSFTFSALVFVDHASSFSVFPAEVAQRVLRTTPESWPGLHGRQPIECVGRYTHLEFA